jgi:hypothetical protein
MRKPAKDATANAAMKAVRVAVTVNAVKSVAMVAVGDVMVVVASAVKAPTAKSAHRAKAVAVAKAAVKVAVKAVMNCVRAKPGPHAANALSVANAQNVLRASVHLAKVVAMAAMRAEEKAVTMAEMKAAAMLCRN